MPKKIYFLVFNFVRGLIGYTSCYKIKYWHPQKIDKSSDTPPRNYANQFIRFILPKHITNKEINILDIGCGSGYVRQIFEELGYNGTYTGVDIINDPDFEKFDSAYFQSNFILAKIENYKIDEKYDVILSLSALEHIENDGDTVKRCESYLKPSGIQLHIVPSFCSLFLYLIHGYRQYNPQLLRKILNIYSQKTDVFRIGGLFSFILHFLSISILELLFHINFRKKKIGNYSLYYSLLFVSNKLDKVLPFLSSLYAIVIRK